jgi:hypothetical protein
VWPALLLLGWCRWLIEMTELVSELNVDWHNSRGTSNDKDIEGTVARASLLSSGTFFISCERAYESIAKACDDICDWKTWYQKGRENGARTFSRMWVEGD